MPKKNPIVPIRGSRKKKPDEIDLREIQLDEAKALKYGDKVYIIDKTGRAAQVRVVSSVKRWKRDPDRIEVSFKFGMFETFRLNETGVLSEIYLPA